MLIQDLRKQIGQTKRQLTNMSAVLDNLYDDIREVREKTIDKKPVIEDTNTIADHITKRMYYLNQVKNKPLMEVNSRLDELSKLLDWMEADEP